jgi:hypothetical protein
VRGQADDGGRGDRRARDRHVDGEALPLEQFRQVVGGDILRVHRSCVLEQALRKAFGDHRCTASRSTCRSVQALASGASSLASADRIEDHFVSVRIVGQGYLRLDYLELVDTPQEVTWAIALLALVVSAATYRLNVRDKSYAWKTQDQAQAEEVAGWLVREMCEEHQEMEWKAYVRNSSKSPVYDVLYVVHDSQDLDAAMPEMIPLIPPDTTWDFFPAWFGDQPEENPRVYMTFRDKRGNAWQRDTHGRLAPFRRNIDNAPPADPVSGRISYGAAEGGPSPSVRKGLKGTWLKRHYIRISGIGR